MINQHADERFFLPADQPSHWINRYLFEDWFFWASQPISPKGPDMSVLHDRITSLFLEKLHLEVPSVDTDLVEAGILDSLQFVDLLAFLEQEFGILISPDDFEIDHFCSIAKIAEFITQHQRKSAHGTSATLS